MTVRHEASQAVPVLGDDGVQAPDRSYDPRRRRRRPLVTERVEQIDAGGASGRKLTVGMDEVPAREPLLVGNLREHRLRLDARERQHGNSSTRVERGDDTRREPAEASAAVVEQNRATILHREPFCREP
jgi:hypothetical protein